MAFREDGDALHARIDSLERELADARTELARLSDIESERDRIQHQLEALEGKLHGKKKDQAKSSRAQSPAQSVAPTAERSWRDRSSTPKLGAMVLTALISVMLLGLLTWTLAECGSSSIGGVATAKPADTRVPSIGVVDLGATPDPAPIPFTVTGSGDPPAGCPGYVPDAPQLVLRTSAPMLTHITTRCDVDLVAVLSGAPSGTLCDDDSGEGTNPQIETVLPPGDARLTIGTYGSGATASCEIELHASPLPADVDASGLAPTAAPHIATVSLAGAASAEQSYAGQIVGVLVEASRAQAGCLGYVSSAPDLVLDIAEPTIARIETRSDVDLVLVMRSPDGTVTCDDDDGMGSAPRIAKRLAPGRYPVWVGPYSAGAAGIAFHVDVRLATIASETSGELPPVDLVDGTPLHVTGTAGDELAAPSMWSECTIAGYVRYRPDRTFRIATGREITVTAATGGAPPLLVVAPHDRQTVQTHASCTSDGVWRGSLESGSYDLYVGVASGDIATSPFDLTITAAPPSVLPYTP